MDRGDLPVLAEALAHFAAGFAELPPVEAAAAPAGQRAMLELAERLRDNFPYHHPLYAGQMLKPPHPVARLA